MILNLINTRFKDADGAFLLVHLIVFALLQGSLSDAGKLGVPSVRFPRSRTGDNKWGTRLINQDRIDLINNREVMPTLHLLLSRPGHIIAQIVEPELVVRAVGDISLVLFTTLLRIH